MKIRLRLRFIDTLFGTTSRFFVLCVFWALAGVGPSHSAEQDLKFDVHQNWPTPNPIRRFFVDSKAGKDKNSGRQPDEAWKTLRRVSDHRFQPGDHILFQRGRQFVGCLLLNGQGTQNNPIVIGAYGKGRAPKLSNPNSGLCHVNALQLRGPHHIVQNLHFHHTAPAAPNAGFVEVWATGALHIGTEGTYSLIRGNRFEATPKAIQSYGEYSLITNNHIDGPNGEQQEGFLSKPYWGPIGIQIGTGNQTVAFNMIENMFVQGGKWGADGGAIEIDDGRNHKRNIHIHNNVTRNNMGFLEISWEHDIEPRATENVVVEHNISHDYQDFVLWWAENKNSRIHHNTIIRTKQIEGIFTDTVFLFDGADIDVNGNIVVIDDETWDPVFTGDEADSIEHRRNLYWNRDGGPVDLGIDASLEEVTGDPHFINIDAHDFQLEPFSPARALGAFAQKSAPFDIRAKGLARDFE